MPSNDLHNLNDLLAELEGAAIETSQGSFVKVEDVRRLIEKRTAAREEQVSQGPPPKTLEEARARIKADTELMKSFPKPPPDAGRAIAAQQPQPASRP
jgi:hypothetical protein